LAKLKREIELAMEEIKQRERDHIRVPSESGRGVIVTKN
jgi:hypothetical protein